MTKVCFMDYLYPFSCGANRWKIVDILIDVFRNFEGVEPMYECISTEYLFDFNINTPDNLNNCTAIVGIETSSYVRVTGLVSYYLSNAYNFSTKLVYPMEIYTNNFSIISNGWTFFKPFTLGVWLIMILVILTAFKAQIFLKKTKINLSPEFENEHIVETLSNSLLASTGSTRLYSSNSTLIFRHLLSCCMALYATFIMAMYSSNLVFFFFSSSQEQIEANSMLPSLENIELHPAYINSISYDLLGLTSGTDSNFKVNPVINNATYDPGTIPIVPYTWGKSLLNGTNFLKIFGYYKSVYEVCLHQNLSIQTQQTINRMVKQIILTENITGTTLEPIDLTLDGQGINTLPQINVHDIWGIFVILGAGYIASLIFRVFFTDKRGLENITYFRKGDIKEVISNCTPCFSRDSVSSNKTIGFMNSTAEDV